MEKSLIGPWISFFLGQPAQVSGNAALFMPAVYCRHPLKLFVILSWCLICFILFGVL